MGAPGVQLQFEKGITSGALQQAVAGAALAAIGGDRHAGASSGVAAYGNVYYAGILCRDAFNQRQITLLHGAVLNLLREVVMGSLILSGNHQAGGILVKAVNDAGANLAADTLDVRAEGEQAVDQRSVGVPRAGVGGQPGRLVYHHEVSVLVNDGQGDVLRDGYRWPWRRNRDQHPVAGADPVGWLHRRAVDQHVAAVYKLAQAAAGKVKLQPGQIVVQPSITPFYPNVVNCRAKLLPHNRNLNQENIASLRLCVKNQNPGAVYARGRRRWSSASRRLVHHKRAAPASPRRRPGSNRKRRAARAGRAPTL